MPEGRQRDCPWTAPVTASLPPCPEPALGRQGEQQMLGWLQSSFLLTPTGNCTNSLLEAEVHTLKYFVFTVNYPKAATAAGNCVSTPTGSLSSTTGQMHCHRWELQRAAHCSAGQSPTATGSDSAAWEPPSRQPRSFTVSHSWSTINAQSSLASHPSLAAVPSTLTHELPL